MKVIKHIGYIDMIPNIVTMLVQYLFQVVKWWLWQTCTELYVDSFHAPPADHNLFLPFYTGMVVVDLQELLFSPE